MNDSNSQYFNLKPLRASNLYGEDPYRSFSVTDYGDRLILWTLKFIFTTPKHIDIMPFSSIYKDWKKIIRFFRDCRDEIFCCEMSPSGNLIAAGTNKGITRIFDVDKGKFFPRE